MSKAKLNGGIQIWRITPHTFSQYPPTPKHFVDLCDEWERREKDKQFFKALPKKPSEHEELEQKLINLQGLRDCFAVLGNEKKVKELERQIELLK